MSAPTPTSATSRVASVERSTKEPSIDVALDLAGTGAVEVSTGLPFFAHMIAQLGRHGGFDLTVTARGDLEVDAHQAVDRAARGSQPLKHVRAGLVIVQGA